MFVNDSTVFVSSANYEYHNVGIDEIKADQTKHFALSLHTGYNTYNTVPIVEVLTEQYQGAIFDITVVNPCQVTHNIKCTPRTEFFTKRGYVSVQKLNDSDVLFDTEGRLCKLLKKNYIKDYSGEVFDLKVMYNNNFVCNDIFVRSVN